MTTKEFNEKYSKFLTNGFYGLRIENENVISFLDDAFQDLILIPGFQYSQIKLKFGVPRFYSNLRSKNLGFMIEQAIQTILLENGKK